ncbi:MAG: FIST C-terminal domain-containing protein [Synergistaceae bacterium]|jgi:hypothetical protein|nr:FIST C-terminal domain-containing protein [Synergistaceae bacterium]
MKSASAISYEIEDWKETAASLSDTIRKKLPLRRNSIGVLFCDADTDGASLSGELKRLLDMDVVGMTTLAPIDEDGRHESAVVLSVLTADDCEFTTAVSEPLSEGAEDTPRRIADAYRRTASPSGPPKLVFICCPYGMPFSGDLYPDVLSSLYAGTPLMGGVASDDYDYERARVFCSGREYKDRLAAFGIAGHVKPAFVLRHVTSKFAERIRRVVNADGNVVYQVGDETLVQYLEGFGLRTDVEDPLIAFTSYPMMLTMDGGGETPLMRHILSLDHETGSGTFFGNVPTGSLANICLVSSGDIMASCGESMNSLLEIYAGEKEYEYSAIFCISCSGRAMILGKDSEAEGRVISSLLPEGLPLTGAYCLGEICPARYGEDDVSNRFHNCSITFCML